MEQQRSQFELYLELLTQVKQGNCLEDTLTKCTNLAPPEFHNLVKPLIVEKLLKYDRALRSHELGTRYQLTDKGNLFIDFLALGLYYAEYEDPITSEPQKIKWIGGS
jgi:predicted transcriptional regulator